MKSKKQPKVHTYSRKKRRHVTSPVRTTLSIVFTFVIAGAIGIVGYSVAKPILQYTCGDSATETQTAETEPIGSSSAAVPVATEAVTTETAPLQDANFNIGIRLPASALTDANTLSQSFAAARSVYPEGTMLVIPLKIQGGAMLYQTENELAVQCGAVQGTLTLSEIVEAATAQGWIPVAECNLLYDNLLPNADARAGYLTTDGSRWLDNRKENGGKAWVSPFSTVTQQYLSDIVREISTAGFAQIWCADAMFPSFRESDLAYIGTQVQAGNREEALVQLVNTLADAAGKIPLLLEMDAAGVMAGTEEVFEPSKLEISGAVLDLHTESQQANTVLQWMSQNAPEMQSWLMVQSADLSEEMTTLKASVSGMPTFGCISYEELSS